MPAESTPPTLRFVNDALIDDVVAEAKTVLAEAGVAVEHDEAQVLLHGAGCEVSDDGRTRIGADLVERALHTVPSQFSLFDRDGQNELRLGCRRVHFAPGSSAINVLDYDTSEVRPATMEDCVRFARLTERLPAFALQSTCIVPSDAPTEQADRQRLRQALTHCTKPIVTGTFAVESFAKMQQMLVAVRGDEQALRQAPLAIFDCCPTAPLHWSELTCAALVDSARAGIPAELISMPMTGATAPVTLLGSLVQHTAESLSGVVIHQLAAPGAPLVYGGCATAFDMRHGTSALAAVEAMLIDVAFVETGKRLGLPTHAYFGLSDAKTTDYQAGVETGCGALVAALAGNDVTSGPGMLDFASCQSLDKLVADHEACRFALRAARGLDRHEDPIARPTILEGIEREGFLRLAHTRKWFRKELLIPSDVIDRQPRPATAPATQLSAADRAHESVEPLLVEGEQAELDPVLAAELERLAKA